MPLTSERPGVFRGTRRSRTRWYVSDPDQPEELERAWKANWAPTNRTRTQWAVKWSIFLVITGLLSAAAFSLVGMAVASFPESRVAAIRVGASVLVVASVILGAWAAARTFPSRDAALFRVPGVVRIPKAVLAWATDETPATSIWQVASAVSRLEYVAIWWKYPDYKAELDSMAESEGYGRTQWLIEADRVRQVAADHGFPIPAGLLVPPVSEDQV